MADGVGNGAIPIVLGGSFSEANDPVADTCEITMKNSGRIVAVEAHNDSEEGTITAATIDLVKGGTTVLTGTMSIAVSGTIVAGTLSATDSVRLFDVGDILGLDVAFTGGGTDFLNARCVVWVSFN